MARLQVSQNIGPHPVVSLDQVRQPIHGPVFKTEDFSRHSYQVIPAGLMPKSDIAFKILGSNAPMNSTTWSPKGNAVVWLDGASIDQGVCGVKDTSDFSQPKRNRQPKPNPITTIPGGPSTMIFTPGDYLICDKPTCPDLALQDFTIFGVAQFFDATPGSTIVSIDGEGAEGAGSGWQFGLHSTSKSDLAFEVKGVPDLTEPDEPAAVDITSTKPKSPFIFVISFDSANGRTVRVNGREIYKDSSIPGDITYNCLYKMIIGGNDSIIGDPTGNFGGGISEIGIIDDDPDGGGGGPTIDPCEDCAVDEEEAVIADVTCPECIEGYLCEKWGLCDELPPDHPFNPPWVPVASYNIKKDGAHADGILYYDIWNFKYAKAVLEGTFTGAERIKVIEKHNA